ncbi:putative nucleic acid-binding Zn-ribbon protein [Virgibacillus halotolerans]|uniref:DUF7359 domain-containing protein n=1 Tax=Virgibacillus halotolerans TaxID=1071053 RepID=UPI001960742F|nr:phage tail protein [Virgibacillus halotolerans]MBM7598077.1 putative nucleic acid-binding Zn-ribbon protein [Virgibacillus halotolerans]
MYNRNSLEPNKPSLFLAKPDKTVIAKLKHIKDEELTVNYGEINELSFTLPFYVDIGNKNVRNPHADKFKEKFLIKSVNDGKIEWFLINSIGKVSDDSDDLNIGCFSLGYQLWYDKMIEYEETSMNCLMVMQDVLNGTDWTVGYINPEFNLKHRKFEVSSQTKLDFIYEIADTFKGKAVFDTVDKTVSFYKEEELQVNKGFKVGYGKYIENIDENIDADEIVTRLYVYGSDGMRINSVNPTGQPYIDDFSYFLYPFEMDENGKVISHSEYMSDNLAKALISYNRYVSGRKDEFGDYLKEKSELQSDMTTEDNRLVELKVELEIILDSITLAKDIGETTSALNINRSNKNKQISIQQSKVNAIEKKINIIDESVKQLREDLKIENHFDKDQRNELFNFIQVDEWTDDNQFDESDLYEAGLEQIKEVNSPPIDVSMGLVNFFEMVSEGHNWGRFGIGDTIHIDHKRIGTDIKANLSQIIFDYETPSIGVTVSNAKKSESDESKIKNAFYTIDKVNTDHNKRKINWNKAAYNFNLRNDRLSEKPTKPTPLLLSHKDNDDGSVNLNLKWDYPDHAKTNKNADNIDGFNIYLHHSINNESYQFGSKMGEEDQKGVSYGTRAFTYPSVPANLYYTIGIQAYRRVDEDVNRDGILLSDIVRFNGVGGLNISMPVHPSPATASSEPRLMSTFNSMALSVVESDDDPEEDWEEELDEETLGVDDGEVQISPVSIEEYDNPTSTPYQPRTDVNLKGKVNGSFHSVGDEPENPNVTDVWISLEDGKTRIWDGKKWSIDTEASDNKKETDKIIGELEEKLQRELNEMLDDLNDRMEHVDSEMDRIENEVIPNVEDTITKTYIPEQDTPPTKIPRSGLWKDTSQYPSRLMRYDEAKDEWVPLAQTKEEIDNLIEQMREDAVLEGKEYTEEEIQAERERILKELNKQTGNIDQKIKDLFDMSEGLKDGFEGAAEHIEKSEQSYRKEKAEIEEGIKELEDVAADLNNRAEELQERIGDLDGKITETIVDVDDALGKISAAVEVVERIDGRVSENSSKLEIQEGLINGKVDDFIYQEDKAGIIESVESNVAEIALTAKGLEAKAEQSTVDNLTGRISDAESTLEIHAEGLEFKADKSEIYTKKEMDEEFKVYENKFVEFDATIDGILGKVSDTEATVDAVTGEVTGIKKDVTSLSLRADGLEGNFSSLNDTIDGIEEDVTAISVRADGISAEIERIESEHDGRISENSTQIGIQAGLIEAKLDSTTYQTDKSGILSEIEANKTLIQATSERVDLSVTKKEFEALVIGGRNLLRSYDKWEKTQASSIEIITPYKFKIIENGSPSTRLEFWVDVEPNTDYTITASVEYGRTAVYHEDGSVLVKLIDNNINETFNTGDATKVRVHHGKYSQEMRECTFSNTQLEKGNKATDWEAAPEDTDAQLETISDRISTTQADLSILAEGVSLKAEKSEVYTKTEMNTQLGDKLDTTVYSNKMSQLDVTIEGIQGSVSNIKSDVDGTKSQIADLSIRADGIEGSVSDISSGIDGISEQVASLSVKADRIETSVSNISVGGRNLWRWTDYETASLENIKNSYFHNFPSSSPVIRQANWGSVQGTFIEGRSVISYVGSVGERTEYAINPIDENGKYYMRLEPNAEYTFSMWYYHGGGIANLQMLVWAYDDDGSNRSNYIANRFSTEYHDKFKRLEWTFKTDDRVLYETRLYIRPDNARPDGTAMSYHMYQPQLEKGNMATSYQQAPEDIGSRMLIAESSIQQNAENINLKVDRDGIVNSLNLSSEGLKIDVNKMDVTGLVSFINSDGSTGTAINGSKLVTGSVTAKELNVNEIFGNSAVIGKIQADSVLTANLSASQITAGTFDAGKISVVNLSASSLIAGEIDASKVNIRNLNAAEMKTGTLTGVDITGVNITGSNFRAKDGDFTLQDNVSNVEYSVTPARNMIQDHSFEMMQPGYSSADSIKHNWVDIDKTINDKWSITGKPKIVTQFAPEDAKALAIHGNRAIAVKDANFVRQYIYEGVGGGAKFTISGFFKRQWNQPPGKPRFEVDVINAAGGRTRLINEIFETVPNDYSVVRRSSTFTVPSNFQIGGSLDVKISGGDSNWVHCDGIQMVEGDKPTVYQPEDSIWEITKGNYNVRNENRLLWSGAVYLRSDHVLYPEKPLEYCNNGWILEWSNYVIGDGATDSDWQYTYISKNTSVNATSSNGARVYLRSGNWDGNEVMKYFTIRGGGERLVGHDTNGQGQNRNMALRAIYEW